MRFIIYGIGAIGGTIAARLALSGVQVIGIARGAQLAAIRDHGLKLRTPERDLHAGFTCVGGPAAVDWQPDDVVVLTMKSQDSWAALLSLRAAGVERQAILCAQNAVANETMALRLFPNVYGCTVMLPATYVIPGEVAAYGTPKSGLFDIGLAAGGTDRLVAGLCAAFGAAGFTADPHEKVMRSKYGKLYLNLGNVVDAALGDRAEESGLADRARAEARAVYEAARIEWDDLGDTNPRRELAMQMGRIDGAERVGSSSAQSLRRGTGSIETDFLNGEIVMLGRFHHVPVPVNEMLCKLGHVMLAEGLPPGGATDAHLARAGWNG